MAKKYSFDSFIDFINDNFALLLIVILVFTAGYLTGSKRTEESTPTTADAPPSAAQPAPPAANADQLKNMPEITDADHVTGAEDPTIYMVVYSDFECPYCNRFHPTAQQIVDDYPDQVTWVYRHYPLGFHDYAQVSAEFSECVAKYEGNEAFWNFTNLLFEKMAIAYEEASKAGTREIDSPAKLENMEQMVADFGWDTQQLVSCIESGEMTDKVKSDMTGATKAGITGTPGTILVTANGQYDVVKGAQPYEQLKAIVESYLE